MTTTTKRPVAKDARGEFERFCDRRRARYNWRAAARADFEARVAWYEREAQRAQRYAFELLAAPEVQEFWNSWQMIEGHRQLELAKSHRRAAVYLLRAGNRGTAWTDSLGKTQLESV